MSDMKKVLTLVACGCICLVIGTSASAEYTGVKTVNKDDAATQDLCTNGNGVEVQAQGFTSLTVCNVFAVFDFGTDRLLNVGNANMQVLNGAMPDVFFQHSAFFLGATSYPCTALGNVPDLICDTYVTIGFKCVPQFFLDGTFLDEDFLFVPEFQFQGEIHGGWANGTPTNGQGDAGNEDINQNLQVLFLQSSVATGHSLEGDIDIFWLNQETGETIAEVDVEILCAAKCIENEACDDGDPCTNAGGDDVCTDGVCTGVPLDCSDLDKDCNEGVCVDGACEQNPIDEGEGCDDGNDCTVGDTCDANGNCVGEGCTDDDSCDDNNACTTDICDPASGCCTNTPDCTSDAQCDDLIDCTDDSCDANGCCVNEPNDGLCDDDNDCTEDFCSPDSGGCVHTPNNDGCDDGLLCTTDDTCSGGSCVGIDVDCPDGADCVEEDLDGDGVGDCVFCETDAECDDGLACNGAETCNPGTGCQDGESVDCTDLDDQCNVGVCTEPDGDCVQEPDNEGLGCDDENACTNAEVCVSGDCVDDDPKDDIQCPDGFVCDPSNGECVEVADFLDIIPGKCPNMLRRNGLGFVKISLLGTVDLDANDVNISTLELARADNVGIAIQPRQTPRPHVRDRATPFLGELCDCHSRRKDGVDDLDMKFKLQEMVAAFELGDLTAGDVIRLKLTGFTNGGQPIRAEDCVVLGRNLGPNP